MLNSDGVYARWREIRAGRHKLSACWRIRFTLQLEDLPLLKAPRVTRESTRTKSFPPHEVGSLTTLCNQRITALLSATLI